MLSVSGAVAAITKSWAACVLRSNHLEIAFGPLALAENGAPFTIFAAVFIQFLSLAARRGVLVGIRIANLTTMALQSRAFTTVLQLIVPPVGFASFGGFGGALGLALATWIGATRTWRSYV